MKQFLNTLPWPHDMLVGWQANLNRQPDSYVNMETWTGSVVIISKMVWTNYDIWFFYDRMKHWRWVKLYSGMLMVTHARELVLSLPPKSSPPSLGSSSSRVSPRQSVAVSRRSPSTDLTTPSPQSKSPRPLFESPELPSPTTKHSPECGSSQMQALTDSHSHEDGPFLLRSPTSTKPISAQPNDLQPLLNGKCLLLN